MKKIVVCASCTGVSEMSIMGIMLIKEHGRDLVRLGVVHRPGCPELEGSEPLVKRTRTMCDGCTACVPVLSNGWVCDGSGWI